MVIAAFPKHLGKLVVVANSYSYKKKNEKDAAFPSFVLDFTSDKDLRTVIFSKYKGNINLKVPDTLDTCKMEDYIEYFMLTGKFSTKQKVNLFQMTLKTLKKYANSDPPEVLVVSIYINGPVTKAQSVPQETRPNPEIELNKWHSISLQ